MKFSGGVVKAKKTKKSTKKVTSGRVSSPVDVRSKTDLAKFETLLEKGPITLVLVYADWCGACHRFKENKWNNVLSMKNRTMNISSVREDMLPETSIANAKVPHYPTLLLVGNDKKPAEFTMPNGEITNALPPEAKENVSKIVQTTMNTSNPVNEVINKNGYASASTHVSTPYPMASAKPEEEFVEQVVNEEVIVPPSMKEDMNESIQNASLVASTKPPARNIVGGGGGGGGGLLRALSKFVLGKKKSRKALKARKVRKTRKTRKSRSSK